MSLKIGLRLCQIVAALQIVSYGDTVRIIAQGQFDTIGLVGPMVRMEAVANGFSALGWAIVLGLSFTIHLKTAGHIAYILAGMLWFDVLTTWRLEMPLPPYFLWWGSAVAALQLLIGYTIERQGRFVEPLEVKD